MAKDNEDIWRKLQEMDNKLDLIQGDMNSLATINKQDNVGLLQDLFKSQFEQSKTRRKIWYYLDEPCTVSELSETSDLSTSQIYNYTRGMREKNLIAKLETGELVQYKRTDLTKGIGLEEHVEEYLDDL